jgi:hypothetical protein
MPNINKYDITNFEHEKEWEVEDTQWIKKYPYVGLEWLWSSLDLYFARKKRTITVMDYTLLWKVDNVDKVDMNIPQSVFYKCPGWGTGCPCTGRWWFHSQRQRFRRRIHKSSSSRLRICLQKRRKKLESISSKQNLKSVICFFLRFTNIWFV